MCRTAVTVVYVLKLLAEEGAEKEYNTQRRFAFLSTQQDPSVLVLISQERRPSTCSSAPSPFLRKKGDLW